MPQLRHKVVNRKTKDGLPACQRWSLDSLEAIFCVSFGDFYQIAFRPFHATFVIPVAGNPRTVGYLIPVLS